MFESSAISLGNEANRVEQWTYTPFESSAISLGNEAAVQYFMPRISLRVVPFRWGTKLDFEAVMQSYV